MRERDGESVWEITEKDGRQWLYATWPAYTPHELIGEEWLPIAENQSNLWTACMIAAAACWKAHPGTPINDLEQDVDAAVRRLRETRRYTAWIGDRKYAVSKTIYDFDVPLDELPSVVRRRVFPVRVMPRNRGVELGVASSRYPPGRIRRGM